MHVRSDGALLPSSTRTAEPKREFSSNNACKVLIDLDSLLSILKIVYQLADETTRQKMGPAQWFTTMNNPSLNTGTTHSSNQGRKEIPPRLEDVNLEDISIQFLCTYSTHPNWKHIVSSRNDYGQTMAHICVTLGYFRLLQHLSTWQIDLNVVDHMGLTALHYAYLFIQEECARLLIHSGAERFILDDLGRSPSSLNPSLEVRVDPNMEIGGDSSPRSILLPPQRRQPWTFRSIFGPQFSFRSPRTSLIKMSALSEYIAGVVLASGVFLRDSLFGQSKSTPSVPPVNGADSRDFVSKMKATVRTISLFLPLFSPIFAPIFWQYPAISCGAKSAESVWWARFIRIAHGRDRDTQVSGVCIMRILTFVTWSDGHGALATSTCNSYGHFSGGWTVLLPATQIPYQSHLIRASVVSVVYWRRKRGRPNTFKKWQCPSVPSVTG